MNPLSSPRWIPETDLASLQGVVAGLLADGAQALMILAADANDCHPEAYDPWLESLPVPVFGGVFPALIHGAEHAEAGFVVRAFKRAPAVYTIANLSDAGVDYAEAVAVAVGEAPEPASMLVLVDGLATRIGAFLDGVYDLFGGDVAYVGGGAGSLSFRRMPCLFSRQGMLADHALLVAFPEPMALSVEHGWEKFAGPFVVTGAQGNRVSHLDFAPAVPRYCADVEADSGRRFDAGNFFDIAKSYPLGMERPDGSLVVRDPIAAEGSELICVGEVPANSIVYLLKGHPERLVAAARHAAQQVADAAMTSCGGQDSPVLVIDCISRLLYLGAGYAAELSAVADAFDAAGHHPPLFGVLSLGEIANGGDYCLEFYNKTLVLAMASTLRP